MIGVEVAHHRILEKLGDGGIGVVYKARDTRRGAAWLRLPGKPLSALSFNEIHPGMAAASRLRTCRVGRCAFKGRRRVLWIRTEK